MTSQKKPEDRCNGTRAPNENRMPAQCTSRSTATEVQIQKLIALLKRRPCHTHELRMFGISHPAGRVFDLVKRGYRLQTDRVTTVDSDGFRHVGVALYSLIAEPQGAEQ